MKIYVQNVKVNILIFSHFYIDKNIDSIRNTK